MTNDDDDFIDQSIGNSHPMKSVKMYAKTGARTPIAKESKTMSAQETSWPKPPIVFYLSKGLFT